MSEHMCSKCNRPTMNRTGRKTFMERVVYPLLGKYPWTCKVCRTTELLSDRGTRRKRRSSSRTQGKDQSEAA
jgi:hypothetical protein